MTDNRRSSPRLGLRFNVSYTIGGQKKGMSVTTNVSGTGIRFIAEHLLAVGTQLDLQIVLPDRAQPIACVGEVAWSRSISGSSADHVNEVGVRFVTILAADQKCLSQYAMLYPDVSKE